MQSNWFQILSNYTKQNGIEIAINDHKARLSHAEVSYLLIEVDGRATRDAENPPATIEFTLHGQRVLASNEQWMDLIDKLTSAAGRGGWSAF